MSSTLLIIGRETGHARDVLGTHARRLEERGTVDDARVLLYEQDPVQELRTELGTVDADTVYGLPASFAHTHDTATAIPGALSAVDGEVRYCEPLGRSPAITDVLVERTLDVAPRAATETSLVLVGFGNSSLPFQEQATEYHATRLRRRHEFPEVHACYLLQNPAAECARYNVSRDAVVVPLFVSHCPSTEQSIPDRIEFSRGGMTYAEPLGTHLRVTDAIAGEIERQRAFGEGEGLPTQGVDAQPVVADGGDDHREDEPSR